MKTKRTVRVKGLLFGIFILVVYFLFIPFGVFAQEDTTPPVLLDFTISPVEFDTALGIVNLEWCATARDDLSGLVRINVDIYRRNNGTFSVVAGGGLGASGIEDTVCGTIPIEQYSLYGDYFVRVTPVDLLRNAREYAAPDMGLEENLCPIGACQLLNRPEGNPVEDTTPPVLLDFTISPVEFDTALGIVNLEWCATARDDLSGLVRINVDIYRRNNGTFSVVAGGGLGASGIEDTVCGTIPIEQYSLYGDYFVRVTPVDLLRNAREYAAPDMGLEENLCPIGACQLLNRPEDTTPPQLVSFSFTPDMINVSTAPQDVICTIEMTEDLSGYSGGYATFMSPSLQQRIDCDFNPPPILGDLYDGTYQGGCTFPQLSESGTWHVTHVQLTDLISNDKNYSEVELISLGFPTELEVVSTPEDTTPPQLVSFSFTPDMINVSTAPQDVICTIEMTEDLSGYSGGYATFMSPSLQQRIDCDFNPPPILGDLYDGTYQGGCTFPQLSESGTWHVTHVQLTDLISNDKNYSEVELISLGFPTELEVVSTEDTDGDGIPDDEDACPSSDLSDTVVIDGWDSGVDNVLLEDGCTISDLISECADDAANHGEFVSAVSHTTNSLKKEGIISGKDKGMIQKGAAKAAIP